MRVSYVVNNIQWHAVLLSRIHRIVTPGNKGLQNVLVQGVVNGRFIFFEASAYNLYINERRKRPKSAVTSSVYTLSQ